MRCLPNTKHAMNLRGARTLIQIAAMCRVDFVSITGPFIANSMLSSSPLFGDFLGNDTDRVAKSGKAKERSNRSRQKGKRKKEKGNRKGNGNGNGKERG